MSPFVEVVRRCACIDESLIVLMGIHTPGALDADDPCLVIAVRSEGLGVRLSRGFIVDILLKMIFPLFVFFL